MNLKTWALIDIEAFCINKGLGMPPRWLKNILAIIGVAFIKVKIWLGAEDPRDKPVDLKEDFAKYGKLLRYYRKKTKLFD